MASHSVKKASLDTDMTPFVDIAFLILTFFIMATKFKPPEPVTVTTPNSVSSQELPTSDAVLITIGADDKVYFSVLSESDPMKAVDVVKGINITQNLGLSEAEMANAKGTAVIGVPFTQLKSYLQLDNKAQEKVKQPGIPVLDSTNNQLFFWIQSAKSAFSGSKLSFLIKGDNVSKYPTFKAVVDALKKNDENKYNLVTSPEDVPSGSDLGKAKANGTYKE